MFTTSFNGKQYVFDSDRLSVNGIPIPYREMSNIAHRGGDQPAFIFDFKGRRFLLPYNPAEMRSILPYFLYARQFSAAPAAEPAQEPEPAPMVEAQPEPEVAPMTEPEIAPETQPEPEIVPMAEPEPEPEIVPEPQPEPIAEPDPEFEPADEPEIVPIAEPEPETEPAPEPYEQETLAPSLDETAANTPPKKKRTGLIIVIGLIILAVIAAIAIFAFGGNSEESDPGSASDMDIIAEDTAEDTADAVSDDASAAVAGETFEATDGFSVTDSDGSMDVKLNQVYLGDDAESKLTELGEDPKDFTEELDSGYRFVLYEYESKVKSGSMIGDTITGEMYMPDKKTEFDDWWPIDLVKNTDKDLSLGEIDIPAGETATLYILYTMPEDMKEYYEKVYPNTDDTEIWVHYVLE